MNRNLEYQKQFEKIAVSLKKADTAKNITSRESALTNAFSEIKTLNFDQIISEVETELKQIADERAKAAESRRESVLQQARDRGIYFIRRDKSDIIGAFRVRYSADKVACDFAEEMVIEVVEFDPVKIVDQIEEKQAKLKESATDRISFINQMRKAFEFAKTDNPSLMQENGIKLDTLHLYMVLSRARNHKIFQKSPLKSVFPDYTKLDFYRDLSVFFHGGVIEAGWRLKVPTPTLSQIKEAIHIPSISHPDGNPTPIYTIKLQKEE